ncbi:MAG: hypothetical protein M1831_004302 [Alyxoria varia]|nr:MAG: hypothetical protein M1831_004302 [Alyxoria varia]
MGSRRDIHSDAFVGRTYPDDYESFPQFSHLIERNSVPEDLAEDLQYQDDHSSDWQSIGTPSIQRPGPTSSHSDSSPVTTRSAHRKSFSWKNHARDSGAMRARNDQANATPTSHHDGQTSFFREAEESDSSGRRTPIATRAPQERRSNLRHGQRLKSSHNSPDDPERDLTEVAAPEPIQEDESGDWRKHEHLESTRARSTSPPKSDRKADWLTQFYIISNLIFFAILGDLVRLGVQWLTFYPGAPVVFGNIWANFGGTLVVGFLQEDRKLFREEWGKVLPIKGSREDAANGRDNPEALTAHSKVKKTIPLFIGLTTGFCGTFTSFSTFLRDVYYALSNSLPTPIDHPASPPSTLSTSTAPRNNGYSLAAVLAVIILTLSTCMCALYLGAHSAILLDRYTPTLPFRFIRHFLDPAIFILGPLCWLGAVFMCIWPPDRPGGPAASSSPPVVYSTWRGDALFSIVFAPLGCLMRYFLSLQLNALIPWFPLGTFAANIFGTAVLSMCFDLQHLRIGASPHFGGNLTGCQLLQGVQDGFCGALTTISTWIVELNALRRRHAYLYGAVSVLVGLALMVVIMGSVQWSVGFGEALCYPGNT